MANQKHGFSEHRHTDTLLANDVNNGWTNSLAKVDEARQSGPLFGVVSSMLDFSQLCSSESSASPLPQSWHINSLTYCPFRDCFYAEPLKDSITLEVHLKKEHKIVFKDLHHMCMTLDKYLEYWANKFLDGELSK